ncbi:protein Z-dependent protease inhibitor [Suncus etruscus]|uniref:protein Z-dependent protease inhibitor n=1 Tax=Suncus etruscus TaxID=109475 RepID=UPI00210FAE92|nr:protein Z-dependent protease inhibitor [Suncus etruscus]
MMIGLGLLLSCLWAQAQLVADSTLISPTPETFEEAMTLLTYTGQDQAYEDMQDTLNQTSNRVQASNDLTDNEARPKEDSEEESWLTGRTQISEGISNLGFSLLRKISMKHDNNVVFSPLSIAFALATLMLGSKGQTRAELERGLGLQNLNRTEHLPQLFRQLRDTLSFNQELGLTQGSFAFIHKDFNARETFLNLSRTYLDTQCVPVNFHNAPQARLFMNHYINKEAKGRIPQFFDEVNPSTKFILVDYILLRGKWLSPFDPTATEVDMFYLDKYQAVKVPMMFQAGKFASTFDKTFRCHVLQLPYRGNASMLVILMENMGDHLALEDYLTPELVDKWLRTMKTREMEIYFPKFKLDQEYGLHKLLKQLGIREVFSTRANLSEISATARDLRVSKVLQRTVFEVDEKGTDAVAGTQSQITAYSMPPIIKLNRPFHFLIYEETSRMLLFLGRVMNPTFP